MSVVKFPYVHYVTIICVRFDATINTGKETNYGYIEDIWELNYANGSILHEVG